MWRGEQQPYCPYCVKRDTVFHDAEPPLPVGSCSISDPPGQPCQYPQLPKEECPIGKFDDFCEKSWAVNPF